MSLFCGKRCQSRKDRRLELKYETKQAKYEMKVDKVEARQGGKTERVTARNDRKTLTQVAAYSNGIDPQASKWGAIASLGSSASNMVTGIVNPVGSGTRANMQSVSAGPGGFSASSGNLESGPSKGLGGSIPWWALLLAVVPFLMKK